MIENIRQFVLSVDFAVLIVLGFIFAVTLLFESKG